MLCQHDRRGCAPCSPPAAGGGGLLPSLRRVQPTEERPWAEKRAQGQGLGLGEEGGLENKIMNGLGSRKGGRAKEEAG